ncbi:MAG: hypothetical protein EZS28_001029 [Streblomastix strix]|uniref:Uncharacterized protein n=1 Tax=Streblomastix strix TaxID=222440 RepID=A0A5J4X8D6_9EUKA|nr:MAG: hypothetical protein EZS28_001029 [Streblomastix strix]
MCVSSVSWVRYKRIHRAPIRAKQLTCPSRNWIQTFFSPIDSQHPLLPLTHSYNAPHRYHSNKDSQCKYWKASPESRCRKLISTQQICRIRRFWSNTELNLKAFKPKDRILQQETLVLQWKLTWCQKDAIQILHLLRQIIIRASFNRKRYQWATKSHLLKHIGKPGAVQHHLGYYEGQIEAEKLILRHTRGKTISIADWRKFWKDLDTDLKLYAVRLQSPLSDSEERSNENNQRTVFWDNPRKRYKYIAPWPPAQPVPATTSNTVVPDLSQRQIGGTSPQLMRTPDSWKSNKTPTPKQQSKKPTPSQDTPDEYRIQRDDDDNSNNDVFSEADLIKLQDRGHGGRGKKSRGKRKASSQAQPLLSSHRPIQESMQSKLKVPGQRRGKTGAANGTMNTSAQYSRIRQITSGSDFNFG